MTFPITIEPIPIEFLSLRVFGILHDMPLDHLELLLRLSQILEIQSKVFVGAIQN
jgi:hypothetical protein